MNRSLKKPGIAVLMVVSIFFPGLATSAKADKVEQVNKEWTSKERQWFYHTSQGSQLMPYKWFLALEQPYKARPFIDPDHLARFRVIPDLNRENNPDLLPVGFAKDPGTPNPSWGEQVGISCAACHTGQINYKSKRLRIDGAPGQLDVNGFLKSLAKAMVATQTHPLKFRRFANKVLGKGLPNPVRAARVAKLKLDLGLYTGGQLEGILEQINANKKSRLKPTTAGFGRIDALGQGGNTLFGKLTKTNLRTLNAPVDILPLWYVSTYGWVQTNSSIRQPMARNIIEALAVNSYLDLPGKPKDREKGYVSSVRMEDSWKMEEMASKLKAPEWPGEELFGKLGKIDPDRVASGKVLYGKLCAGCHAPQWETPTTDDGVDVLPQPYPPDAVAQKAGKRYYHLRIFNLYTIGTDPGDAENFAGRYADARAIGLQRKTWGPEVIYPVIAGIMKRYYTDNEIPTEKQVEWNGYRGNYWRAPKAYPARPLAGIWATAPFLHNGSVPNLYELLSPVEKRSKTFYRGNLEYDPEHLGFESKKEKSKDGVKLFEFDTAKKGNSNFGHEFRDGTGKGVIGRKLSKDERLQIIEYLKVLRFEDEVPPEGDTKPGNATGGQQPATAPTY